MVIETELIFETEI